MYIHLSPTRTGEHGPRALDHDFVEFYYCDIKKQSV